MAIPSHPEEVKQEILRLAETRSLLSIQREYGVAPETVRRWQKAVAKQKQHIISKYIGNVVLVIPDMHHPFCHPDTLAFLRAVRAKYHPNKFVCLGDEVDFHSFSRYIPDPDGHSPGKELAKSIEALTPFYIEFPEMLVCESNHTVRPLKKMFDAGLPAAFLPTYSKMLNAPDGWRWAKKHEVDGVLYVHGDNGKSGQYAAVNYMKQAKQPVVIGHIHAYASVFYEGSHFAMNAGCLIDKEAYAFKYAKGALLDVSLGCGIVVNGKHAFFIPMHLDQNNRWTGSL